MTKNSINIGGIQADNVPVMIVEKMTNKFIGLVGDGILCLN